MLLLRKLSSGFYGDEDERSKNIMVCSLMINREKENTLAPLYPSEFQESKQQKNYEHSNLFLYHSELLLTVQDEFEGPHPSHLLTIPPHKCFNHAFLDELQGLKVFSKTNLRKTTFKTKDGLFCWLVIFKPNKVKFPLES